MEPKIFLGKYRLRDGADNERLTLPREAAALTYHAEEINSGRDVTVRSIRSDSLTPMVLEQLEAEATAAKQLVHLSVPAVYDFGFEDDHAVYATEYVDGTTAEDWVAKQGPMPVDAVLRIALQILGGLGAAAFHGIVHHAINPSNVMIVPGQIADGGWPLVKLLHLIGIAPKLSTSSISSAAADNSANFASPEQLETGVVDFASEIYSLGCTLVFLLTGKPPIAHAGETGLSGVPKHVAALLAQMLALNPNERPRDPLAFYGQIEDALAQVERRDAMARTFGLPPTSIAPIVEKAPRKPIPVKVLSIAAALLAVATLAALILPALLRHNSGDISSTSKEDIGVPIGVPESADSPIVATNSPAQIVPAPSTVATSAPDSRVVTDSESAPATVPTTRSKPATNMAAPDVDGNSAPALVSTEGSPAATYSASAAPDLQNEQSSEIAATNSSHLQAAPAAAPQSAQAPEASAKNVEQRPTAVASTEPSPAAEPESDSRTSAASAAKIDKTSDDSTAEAPVKHTEPAVTAKTQEKRSTKKTAVAKFDASDLPPIPPGTVRAKFVGTTPDGELIFGLPSSRTGIATVPESADPRKERRRHRVRRATPVQESGRAEEPVILRALPVDE